MRRTLLALALAGAALVPTSADANPLQFERHCTGKVDTFCYDEFCGIVTCQTRDCVVYYDRYQGWNTSMCVGLARPDGDPVES